MDSSKLIRVSVIILLLIAVASYFVNEFEKSAIPADISLAVDTLYKNSRSHLNTIAALLAMIFIVLYFVGCAGILLKQSWSKITFTIPAIGLHTLHPVFGLSVLPPWSATIDSIQMLLSGFLIALLYYSDNSYFIKNAPNKAFNTDANKDSR